jgi:hypothetical protein
MLPKRKAQINIPLCKMILMPIVHLVLKINVLKMEQAFHFGYREGDKVFYVSHLIKAFTNLKLFTSQSDRNQLTKLQKQKTNYLRNLKQLQINITQVSIAKLHNFHTQAMIMCPV